MEATCLFSAVETASFASEEIAGSLALLVLDFSVSMGNATDFSSVGIATTLFSLPVICFSSVENAKAFPWAAEIANNSFLVVFCSSLELEISGNLFVAAIVQNLFSVTDCSLLVEIAMLCFSSLATWIDLYREVAIGFSSMADLEIAMSFSFAQVIASMLFLLEQYCFFWVETVNRFA